MISTTAYADSSGEIQTVSDVVEFRPDPASVERSSVLGSNNIVELVSSPSDFNILNPDANINSCFEYAVALNWDYYQYRASFDDASDSMALFELGMTAAGGDVVTRLANGEMLRNRAYHGLGGSASACKNNTRCLQSEDQPAEAFPDYMAASTTGRIVRNAFHMLNDAELDAVSARDRRLANALESSMAQTFSSSWAEHRNRYNALRSTDVDVLNAHYVARSEFVDLVMQRREKAAEASLSRRNTQIRAELDALDDLIADALTAADANGCIGSTQTRTSRGSYRGRRYYAAPIPPRYTACDWAPSDFTSQLARQMEVIASGRLSECTSTDLHNGFTHYSTGAAGYENYEYTDCVEIPRLGDVSFNRTLPRNTFADETTVEPQLAEIAQAYENSLNCEMRTVHLNWTGSDDQEIGLPELAYGRYAYAYDVGVGEDVGQDFCDAEPHIIGDLVVEYGYNGRGIQTLASAQVDISSRERRAFIEYQILDHDIVTLVDVDGASSEEESASAETYNWQYSVATNTASDSGRVQPPSFYYEASTRALGDFPIPVDVTFTAELELNYGVDIELDATPVEMDEGEDCYIFSGSFTGEAEPRIEMRAHVTGADVDEDTARFKIAGGGNDENGNPIPETYVAFDLEATNASFSVEAALPVELDIDITAVEDLSNVTLDVEASAGLSVKSGLAGGIAVQLEDEDGNRKGGALGGVTVPFNFNGPDFEMTFFDEEHEFDVDTWAEICELYGCTES